MNAPMLNMMSGWFGASAPSQDQFGARLRVPAGFSVGLFAEKLPSVRFLRPLPGGGLLATTPREGKVWLLTPDRDGDGRADAARPLLEQLNRPHGMDLLGDWLYVAEGRRRRTRAHRSANRRAPGRLRARGRWPSGGGESLDAHRSLRARRMDVRLASARAATCASNPTIAVPRCSDSARTVSEPQIFATGLRNSVGFDWQPGTNALYATDNGRDLLGDDFPPCELNLVELGGFYGWPFANGDRVPDPDLGSGQEERIAKIDSAQLTPSARIPPPSASSSCGTPTLPEEWRGAALVALHGSWNRTRKSGYKVVSLHWGADGTIAERDFLVGFEEDENVIGRPSMWPRVPMAPSTCPTTMPARCIG